MAGPWIFSTLVGLSMLAQLCNARVMKPPNREIIDPKDDSPNSLLRRIVGNVRRISDILAFQMLEEQNEREAVDERRASMNSRRKCIVESLVIGRKVEGCMALIRPKEGAESTRRSFGSKKRRLNNNSALNSNSNININNNSNNKGDNSFKSETPSKSRKSRRPNKKIYKNKPGRSKPGAMSQAANTNFNENVNTNFNTNVNTNFNDEVDGPGGLNDENDGLGALSDNDDGAGALNDDIDGLGDLNDETDGPGSLSDEADGAGVLNDEGLDEKVNFNDEDEGPGALNDEDYTRGLNDEEQLADEFEK